MSASTQNNQPQSNRRARVFLIIGLTVTVAVLLVASAVYTPLARRVGLAGVETLRCEPAPGMSAAYRLSMHTQLKMNAAGLLQGRQAGGRMVATDVGLSARLRLQALERRQRGVLVALALDNLDADSGGQEVSEAEREQLTLPFYAVLEPDCGFSSFGFQSVVEDDVVNRLQGLLQGLSLSVQQDGSKPSWISREYDAVGQYTARYMRSPDDAHALEKHRQAYLRAHSTAGYGVKEPLLVQVLDSETPVTLDEDFAWLLKLQSREHLLVTRAKGGVVAELRTTLSLERRDDHDPAMALTDRRAQLRWRMISASPLVAAPRLPDPPDALKALALPEALAEYTDIMRSGDPGAALKGADFLALYLRAQPLMASELMKLLEDQTIPAELESTVFLGLERAGTPEAHAALIAGLSDAHASRNRARAAAALPDIKHPSEATLQALKQTAQGAVGESPDATRLVRNAASYAMGTLERRTRELNPALAEQARTELRNTLANARDVQQRAAALDAVANSGSATLLRDVRPLMNAQEPLVRAHAIESMGNMAPEANKDLFGVLIANEPDPKIRGAIAATYAEQARRAEQSSPSEVLDAAIEQLGREPDPRVKGLLIELIGPACSTNAVAQQSLGTHFQRETDPILLKLIGKYVPADRLGH